MKAHLKVHRFAAVAALLSGAVLTTSCESFLDIQPVAQKPDINSYDTADKVDATLLAAYNQLQDGAMYGGQLQVLGELLGDNIDFNAIVGTGGDGEFRSRQFSIFTNPAAGTWRNAYTAIFRANQAIEAVEKSKFTADAAISNRIKGEGLFIRAISHFELLRLFAKPYSSAPATDPGVPLRIRVVSSNEAANDRTARAPVGEVYAQVIADLQQAATLLPPANGDRPTTWAAKAYLARVYFEQNDFANADRLATDVIANGGFTLGTPPNAVTGPFRQQGLNARYSSVIFQLVNFGVSDGAGGLRSAFFNQGGSAFVRLPLNTSGADNIFNALRTEGGARYTELIRRDSATVRNPDDIASTRPQSLKYTGADTTGTGPGNVPVLRLQELLLTRAESRAELGQSDASVRADLNAVRAAAGRPANTTATGKAALQSAVRAERRVELVLEGDRFQQLRRLRLPSRGIAFNSGRLLPIPLDEVNGNTGIVQNGD